MKNTNKYYTAADVEKIMGCSRPTAIKAIIKAGGEQSETKEYRVLLDRFNMWYNNPARSLAAAGGEKTMVQAEKLLAKCKSFAREHGGIRSVTAQKRSGIENYYARLTGEDGRDTSVSLHTSKKKEAEQTVAEILVRFRQKLADGLIDIPTAEYFAEWLAEQPGKIARVTKQPIKARSIGRFKTVLEKAAKHLPGEVSQTTEAHIESYIAWLRREGFKPASIHLEFQTLKRVYQRAVKKHYIAVNPCADWETGDKPAKPAPDVQSYRSEDMAKILAELDRRAITGTKRRVKEAWKIYSDIFHFMYYTGARVSDSTALKWHSVSFFGAGTITFIQRKTNKKVTVVMCPQLRARLLALRPATVDLDALVFPNTSGGEVAQGHLDAAIRRVLRDFGIVKKSPIHSFRHTSVEMLVAAGVPIHEIAGQVGDTVETIVENYIKPREASAANIARAYAETAALNPSCNSVDFDTILTQEP